MRRHDDEPVPQIQRWGAVVWPSFFAAGVATMVFFAMFDPAELSRIAWIGVEVDRQWGYTIGFFLFWICTFSASLFTSFLMRGRR
jgi:uncharacterized membrane protein